MKDGLASGAYPVRLGMRLVVAMVLPPKVPVVQVRAPQVSVPVNVGLANGAYAVRLGIRLVVAIVFPPNVPLVQVRAPQVRALLPQVTALLKVVVVLLMLPYTAVPQ